MSPSLLLLLVDVLAKSVLVLLAFTLIAKLVGHKLTCNSRHMLWLSALFCLALLPGVPLLVVYATPNGAPSAASLIEFTVSATSVSADTTSTGWGHWLLIAYTLPCFYLLMRMAVALCRLGLLRKNSVIVQDLHVVALLAAARSQIGISRQITLRYSDNIDSPLSFGLLSPQIILPSRSQAWSDSVVTDVLLHELSHIRRLDWLSMLFGYLVACAYWINPIVWRVLRKLHEEAENSCDTAVIHAGRSDKDYAQSLISVARACRAKHESRRMPLTQTMLDRSTLKTRIIHLFEEKNMKLSEFRSELKKAAVFFLLVSTGLLTASAGMQVVSAQTPSEPRPHPQTRDQPAADQELIPLHTPDAAYPSEAASQGVEGWAHMQFTITSTGAVDDNSIVVLDAEPTQIFDDSSREALRQFSFQPRVVNGQAVAVPNVEYVFRYTLSPEAE